MWGEMRARERAPSVGAEPARFRENSSELSCHEV